MKNYMLSRIYASSTAIKMDKSYLYDYNGNVLAITDNITPSYKQTFTYDPFQITGTHDYLDRLHIATSVMYGTKTYEYDAIGNITLKDGLGYYYAQCPHQVIADDNHDYSYDSNGNMAVKYDYSVDPNIEWDYSYDYNNMLTSASQNGGFEMSNEYDPTGARIYKEEYSDAYGWEYTTYFFPNYEEVSKEAEYDCTRYISANGKRLAENRTINDYSTGATTSTVYYYYNDHLGSSSRISSMQGKTLTLSKLYEYDPYGKTAVENPAYGTGLDERFKFNGKEQDASTGLYYYGARYYSQELGKYITPDSATPGSGFDLQGFNRYAYCDNNPIKYVDPTGHDPEDTIGLGVSGLSLKIIVHGLNWSKSISSLTFSDNSSSDISGMFQYGLTCSYRRSPYETNYSTYGLSLSCPFYNSITGSLSFSGDRGTYNNTSTLETGCNLKSLSMSGIGIESGASSKFN